MLWTSWKSGLTVPADPEIAKYPPSDMSTGSEKQSSKIWENGWRIDTLSNLFEYESLKIPGFPGKDLKGLKHLASPKY